MRMRVCVCVFFFSSMALVLLSRLYIFLNGFFFLLGLYYLFWFCSLSLSLSHVLEKHIAYIRQCWGLKDEGRKTRDAIREGESG